MSASDGAASWEEPEGRQAGRHSGSLLHLKPAGQSGSRQVAGGLASLSPQACWGDAGPHCTLPHCQEED